MENLIEELEEMKKRYDVISATEKTILRVRSYNEAINDVQELLKSNPS